MNFEKFQILSSNHKQFSNSFYNYSSNVDTLYNFKDKSLKIEISNFNNK